MVGFNLLHNYSLVKDWLQQNQKGQFLATTHPQKCNRNNVLKGISISKVAAYFIECVGLSD